MNKKQLKKSIANQHDLKQCNLDVFDTQQLEDLMECGEAVVTLKQLRRIFKERNTKAAKNSELALKNSRQSAMIQKLEKELEEYKKGQDLYGIIGKPLVEMSDEELKTLGLVTIVRANAALQTSLDEIDRLEEDYANVVKLMKKTM